MKYVQQFIFTLCGVTKKEWGSVFNVWGSCFYLILKREKMSRPLLKFITSISEIIPFAWKAALVKESVQHIHDLQNIKLALGYTDI